eukprot:GCRY01001797.1.p1 GENE.GCRY01001797.1~~GCRY01001797.1.p1  ORF type:complete len:139 (+),score=35.58 GCRY01001797.1:155-571(+)
MDSAQEKRLQKLLFDLLKNEGQSETAVIERIVNRGISLHCSDEDGWTPMHWACLLKRPELVSLFFAANAALDAQDKNGWTPLHTAAYQGDEDSVLALCTMGANTALTTNDGMTAVELAVMAGHERTALLLFREKNKEK